MRRAAPAATLIEEDETVTVGIEVASPGGSCARARAAVNHECWFPFWIAALLPIDLITVPRVLAACKEFGVPCATGALYVHASSKKSDRPDNVLMPIRRPLRVMEALNCPEPGKNSESLSKPAARRARERLLDSGFIN